MGTPYHHSFSTPSGGPGIRIDRESPWPWRGEAFRIELWGNPEGWSQVVELRFAVLRFVPNGNSPWMSLFVSSYTKNGGFSHCYVRFTGGYMFFFKNLIVWLFLNGFQPKMGFLGDWWVFFFKVAVQNSASTYTSAQNKAKEGWYRWRSQAYPRFWQVFGPKSVCKRFKKTHLSIHISWCYVGVVAAGVTWTLPFWRVDRRDALMYLRVFFSFLLMKLWRIFDARHSGSRWVHWKSCRYCGWVKSKFVKDTEASSPDFFVLIENWSLRFFDVG